MPRNRREHCLSVAQHVVVPESNDLVAALLERRRPDAIVFLATRIGMLPTVEFDHQPQFETSEVGEVRADRMLATKAQAEQTPAA